MNKKFDIHVCFVDFYTKYWMHCQTFIKFSYDLFVCVDSDNVLTAKLADDIITSNLTYACV